jgi:hypothetical protein
MPYRRTPQGFRYYTFAGTAINKGIAKWTGAGLLSVGDFFIELTQSVDWTRLPATSSDLFQFVRPLSASAASQTVFQQNLPADLMERELNEAWLKDEEIPLVLHRLRTATPAGVSEGAFTFMETA